MAKRKYDLAISFAGEQRELAEALAQKLDASGYSIFYDQFEAAQLWGTELPIKLGEIYEKQARFCLVVVSNDYVDKMWTNVERRYAISRAISDKSDYILPLKIHSVELPGLPPTIGYISLRDTSENEIYNLLLQKLGKPHHSASSSVSKEDQARVRRLLEACYRRALFTRMDSEINMDAMFGSLGECIGIVQQVASTIEAPDLQHVALSIVGDLDRIERYSIGHRHGFSHEWSLEERHDMDKIKLNIVATLLQLRRKAKIQFQLPTSLSSDHFYSLEQANEQPRK